MAKFMRGLILPALLALLSALLLTCPVLANGNVTIESAQVFSGYLEDGDWLVAIRYRNINSTYNTTYDSRDCYLLQLTKVDNTTIAQVPLPAWGYKPGSIYLSATSTAPLEWGSAYKVRLNNTIEGVMESSYTLTAIDWQGSNLSQLDSWCIIFAKVLESYYGTTFVEATAGKGDVLNEEGGVIFTIGMPYLSVVRPNIFKRAVFSPEYTETEWGQAYEESLPTWSAAVGPEVAAIFNDAGILLNLEGQVIGGMLVFIAYIAIAGVALAKGHGMAGIGLALPLLFVGFYFRLIPMAVLGVALAIVSTFFVWHFWWRST